MPAWQRRQLLQLVEQDIASLAQIFLLTAAALLPTLQWSMLRGAFAVAQEAALALPMLLHINPLCLLYVRFF